MKTGIRRKARTFRPNDPQVFAINLRRILHERSIPVSTFAKRAGIYRSNINRYMAGECYPGFENIHKIADTLELPVADLFVDNGRVPKTSDVRAQKLLRCFSQLSEIGKDRLVHAAKWELSWLKEPR